jgi:hypothetical protein
VHVAVAGPVQFDFFLGALFLIGVFDWNDGLFVFTVGYVAVWEDPHSLALWFVSLEVPAVVDVVVEFPDAADDIAVRPGSLELHLAFLEDIGAIAVLLPIPPPAGVDIAIWIDKDPLAMPYSALEVPMVGPFLIVRELSNPMLQVLTEFAFVLISITVAILPEPMALAI